MIRYYREHNMFALETVGTSYIFCVEKGLRHIHWGEKVREEDCFMLMPSGSHSSFDMDIAAERSEFDFFTGASYLDACLKVDFGDRRRLDMVFTGYDIEEKVDFTQLRVYFKNSFTELFITIEYDVYEQYDIISRRAKIENRDAAFVIESAMSAAVVIPQLDNYRARYAIGKWSGEFQIKDIELNVGKFVMQSKRGHTGPHFNPAFAIDDGKSCETSGQVWFGLLGHSGNWKIEMERTVFNNMRVVGGINDFDFAYELKTGEVFTTPSMVIGFTTEGYGGMSRALHDFQRDVILPVKNKPSRVLYNSWEATAFDVNVKEQMLLANKAKDMGVELFVIDDGWFGERHSDRAGLGDWYVNEQKFPNGLRELIDHVLGLGMDFGIWVEPEAVNPDSDLFRVHPDWIYSYKDLEAEQARNQFVLNIGKPEVKAFILQFMRELLSQNEGISFVKWDMNRSISDMSGGANTLEDKSFWVKHVHALYEIWETLRREFPRVEFETCSGGGGRIDLGILRFADQCWPSDNTDAYDRLFIQEGFSYFYNPKIMMCWVTDNHGDKKFAKPVSYKFHSAMMGGLGIGANIAKLDDATIAEYIKYIALYKEIRETVQFGRQYRLRSPRDTSGACTVEYVSADGTEVLVFSFLRTQKFGNEYPMIRLQGLDKSAMYICTETGMRMRGDTLMYIGVKVSLHGDLDSKLLRLRKEV